MWSLTYERWSLEQVQLYLSKVTIQSIYVGGFNVIQIAFCLMPAKVAILGKYNCTQTFDIVKICLVFQQTFAIFSSADLSVNKALIVLVV